MELNVANKREMFIKRLGENMSLLQKLVTLESQRDLMLRK